MSQKDMLLRLLAGHPGKWFTHSRLATRTHLSHQAIFQLCSQLAIEGKIHRERLGREWWVCRGEPREPIGKDIPAVIRFDWIPEAKLRDVVRADWEEANGSLHYGNWKAAVILSGACLEGVLVATLQKRDAEVRKLLPADLRDYSISGLPLRQLARIAERFGLLGSRQAEFLVKSRNLIHPGVAAAEATPLSRADAQAAVELLAECIRRSAEFS
jgi:hypothetical protein